MRHIKLKYLVEFIIHALAWVAVYYALRALTSTSFRMVVRHEGTTTERIAVNTLFPYSLVVLGALMALFYGNIYWIFKNALRYKNNWLRLLLVTGWFVILFSGDFIVVRLQIPQTKNHAQINNGNLPAPYFPGESYVMGWSHMQLLMLLIFLSILGVSVAYFFIKEWIRNDMIRSQIESQQLSTEIKFLRSQVNPHFLFNTLNNLFSMAQKNGQDGVADGISKLSGMMRYMIYESNTEQVGLTREIEYLENCIALNKLRYADKEVCINFTHPAPTAISGVQIAPMLFIPFLENAFKHGVSIGQRSCVAMTIKVDDKILVFDCENTDHSSVKKLDEDKIGIGLENVKRRLELLYPDKHALRTSSEDGKYLVNLQIDLS